MLNADGRLRLGEDQFKVFAAIASSHDEVIGPDLPTLSELGVDFIAVPSPIGVLMPGEVSDDIAATLADATEEEAGRDSFRDAAEKRYIPVKYLGPEDGTSHVEKLGGNADTLLPKLRNVPKT